MKKLIIVFLCIMTLIMSGCSLAYEVKEVPEAEEQTVNDQTANEQIWSVTFPLRTTEEKSLETDDIRFLNKILSKDRQEGLCDCAEDVVFKSEDGSKIKYSSDCGIFNDAENGVHIELGESERQQFNEMLCAYGKPGFPADPVTVLSAEEQVPLAVVGCFGSEWYKGGMAMWDGPFVDDVLGRMVEAGELGSIAYSAELEITFSEETELHGVYIYNESCERILEFDSPEELGTLEPGTYHAGIAANVTGRYIKEVDEYEKSHNIYLFTLVVK